MAMKVGVVGSGLVGATAAYALVMQGIGREIVMVDLHRSRAEAEANDLLHAVPFANPLTIRSGDYQDLEGSRVVILAAGVNQQVGETRLHLLQRNAAVFAEIVPRIIAQAPECVLLIATNPVDIMTHLAGHFAVQAGFARSRVIGSGTMLDTARFRTLLARHFDIDAQHVHGYVIGEHGDSEVLTWSTATIAGQSLEDFGRLRGRELSSHHKAEIDQAVRRAAYHIIEGKGATYYGIGSALARAVDAIVHDQRAVLTVCSYINDLEGLSEITISMPHVLSGSGVIAPIPLELSDAEHQALVNSAGVIRQAVQALEL